VTAGKTPEKSTSETNKRAFGNGWHRGKKTLRGEVWGAEKENWWGSHQVTQDQRQKLVLAQGEKGWPQSEVNIMGVEEGGTMRKVEKNWSQPGLGYSIIENLDA